MIADDVYEIDAACPLDRLSDMVKIELPESDSESVSGYVLERLGRLGRPGDIVPIDGWQLVVVQADPNRIRRLRLEKLPSPAIVENGETVAERHD
jgi:CBS domain containing-hemolysin-like protein